MSHSLGLPLLLLLLLLLLPPPALSSCLPATWEQVCDRAARKCVLIASLCPPYNNILYATRRGSMSRIGDAGYVVEYWPYSECAFDAGVGADNSYAKCKDRALAYMLDQQAGVFSDPTFIPAPGDVQQWEVGEIAASNLVIQGFNGTVPFKISHSPSIIESNALNAGQGALCRLFWLTGRNVTIRNAVIDTSACCTYFPRNELSVADCTPIVCTGTNCSHLTVEKSQFLSVGAAVRIERDDGGMTDAIGVRISIDQITTFDPVSLPVPISLVFVDAAGSVVVNSPTSLVFAKVGTYDTTITVSSRTRLVNMSDYVSASQALFVLDDSVGDYRHESPKNVIDTAVVLGLGLLAVVLALVLMATCVSAYKKDLRKKEV